MKSSQRAANQRNSITSDKAEQVEIVYYTDPLCCWSWGFEPQWRLLLNQYAGKVKWRYCMGGLLPSWKNFIDPLNSVSRPVQMGPVWMEASHITGMPIESSLWIKNPPKSSYPACIAVKAAGLQSFEAEDVYLRRLREATMLYKQDISNLQVLHEIAKRVAMVIPDAFDFARFVHDLHAEDALEAFRQDISEIQSKQIPRFPTLIFRKQGRPPLIITGYRNYKPVSAIMEELQVNRNKGEYSDAASFYKYYGSMTEREKKEMEENGVDLSLMKTS